MSVVDDDVADDADLSGGRCDGRIAHGDDASAGQSAVEDQVAQDVPFGDDLTAERSIDGDASEPGRLARDQGSRSRRCCLGR